MGERYLKISLNHNSKHVHNRNGDPGHRTLRRGGHSVSHGARDMRRERNLWDEQVRFS